MDAGVPWGPRVRALLARLSVPLVPVVSVVVVSIVYAPVVFVGGVLYGVRPTPFLVGATAAISLVAVVVLQTKSLKQAFWQGLESPVEDLRTAPPDDDVAGEVQRLAAQADVQPPRVDVVETGTPEAFTVCGDDGDPKIVLSRSLLEELGARERRAVLAHEIAHVESGDVAAMRRTTVPLAASEVLRERLANGLDEEDRVEQRRVTTQHMGTGVEPAHSSTPELPLASSMLAFVTGWLGRTCAAVASVGREYAADARAASLTGDPAALADALVAIDEQLREAPDTDLRTRADVRVLNVVSGEDHWLLSTHPPTEQRVERLQQLAEEQ